MLTFVIVVLGSFFIGSIVGLLGAGGAILSIPILTHLLHFPKSEAMGASLLIVFAGALSATIRGWPKREFSVHHALIYGVIGAVFSWFGARYAPDFPELLRGRAFIGLLVVAGFVLMLPRKPPIKNPPSRPFWMIFLRHAPLSALIATISSVLGVSGGFMIVPMLHRWSRVPLSSAVSTSLLIICFNSGFASLGTMPFLLRSNIDWWPVVGLICISVFFAQLMGKYRARVNEKLLRTGFALFLWAVALAEVLQDVLG